MSNKNHPLKTSCVIYNIHTFIIAEEVLLFTKFFRKSIMPYVATYNVLVLQECYFWLVYILYVHLYIIPYIFLYYMKNNIHNFVLSGFNGWKHHIRQIRLYIVCSIWQSSIRKIIYSVSVSDLLLNSGVLPNFRKMWRLLSGRWKFVSIFYRILCSIFLLDFCKINCKSAFP